jgi:hypothetical protein
LVQLGVVGSIGPRCNTDEPTDECHHRQADRDRSVMLPT